MSPPMYRDSTSGYWGFPTSTMDWCEENYAVTRYIAEFCKFLIFFCPIHWVFGKDFCPMHSGFIL